MLTGRGARKPGLLADFLKRDQSTILRLPQGKRIEMAAKPVCASLEAGVVTPAPQACWEFLSVLSALYKVTFLEFRQERTGHFDSCLSIKSCRRLL
jgi:hypothetical protein